MYGSGGNKFVAAAERVCRGCGNTADSGVTAVLKADGIKCRVMLFNINTDYSLNLKIIVGLELRRYALELISLCL